ncbi:ArnT family glycosyltransferase [Dyadobacter tibetensis]|uniref:ArnT family glycosyltransferase n=1 Tax=Dyadobacter tibetensis TaxID=1211851 RepID=UPI00046FDA92|nr:glycosyltransferase family 39 protein [Dyadobacter tibetensis]
MLLELNRLKQNMAQSSADNGAGLPKFGWLLLVSILLNIPALWLPIIEPDGALYATIAKKMVLDGDWLNMYGNGSDWLDKPHFPFWVTALSYSIFGINSFAYKLPAFIFWLLGLRYTYLTGRLLYSRIVAQAAVLIQATALHTTLANFDVRAEPYLTTCIIAAIYHMLMMDHQFNWRQLFWAAAFTAMAMMTKGLFVLISIGAGWGIYWMVTRQWKALVDWRWWAWLVLSFVLIGPELFALYQQFDLHPEKVVFGRNNVSGIRFFFWDSQFGRFFNTGPIKGSGDPTFFVHTTLWAFLPWTVGLLVSLFYGLRSALREEPLRWVIIGSAAITFLLFSLSKFQLPHYIIISFPYFALMTAYALDRLARNGKIRPVLNIQKGMVIIIALLFIGLTYFANLPHWPLLLGLILLSITGVFVWDHEDLLANSLMKGVATFVLISGFLFLTFYPFLFQYQSGSEAVKAIPDDAKHLPIGSYHSFSYAFEFYATGEVELLNNEKELDRFIRQKPVILYTRADIADSLVAEGWNAKLLTDTQHFHITRLKGNFLNKNTRAASLEDRRLLLIE